MSILVQTNVRMRGKNKGRQAAAQSAAVCKLQVTWMLQDLLLRCSTICTSACRASPGHATAASCWVLACPGMALPACRKRTSPRPAFCSCRLQQQLTAVVAWLPPPAILSHSHAVTFGPKKSDRSEAAASNSLTNI